MVAAGRCNLWHNTSGAVAETQPNCVNTEGRPQCRPFVCKPLVLRITAQVVQASRNSSQIIVDQYALTDVDSRLSFLVMVKTRPQEVVR